MNRLGIVVILFMFLFPVDAAANYVWHSGVVKGKLKGFSKLGQYCDCNGNCPLFCTAAKYKEADYNRYQPLREMKVRIYINNRLAGQGSTNTLGDYQISWGYASDASVNFVPPYVLRVQVSLEHKEGRFQVWDDDGTPHNFYGSTYNIQASSQSNPQNLGTWYWGTSNYPHPTMQVYEAAWRTWYYAFRHTNRLSNHFNNLKITYAPSASASAFYDDPFEIEIRTASAYSVISHEMGHAASYKASHGQSFRFSKQYCYPYSSGNCPHNLLSDEWASVQFEEGLATFLGNVSAYWSQNHNPLACSALYGTTPCPTLTGPGVINLEASSNQSGNSVSRREKDVATYLRDLYDDYDNTFYESSEQTDLNLYHIVDSINDFTNSNGNGGKNEPWASFTQFDDLDGRSAKDFQHYIDIAGNISSSQSQQLYQMNGNPAGAY